MFPAIEYAQEAFPCLGQHGESGAGCPQPSVMSQQPRSQGRAQEPRPWPEGAQSTGAAPSLREVLLFFV